MDSVEKKEKTSMDSMETILNYSFTNKNLLKDAVTQSNGTTFRSFKRLEFLGDSVLNLAFTNYFHLTFPDLKDNELKELLVVNTCNDKFARVAVKHGLFPFLICSPQRDLVQKIEAFTEAVSKEADLVWYQGSVEAPKILADFVEAIAGAVYIDVDFDLERFWKILKGFLEPIFMPDDLRRRYQPVDTLLRLGKKRVVFKYCNEDETRVVANVYFDGKFIASGYEKTECRAKIVAAKEAIKMLSTCKIIDKRSSLVDYCKIIEEPSSVGIRKNVEECHLDVENEADKGSLDAKKRRGIVEEKPDMLEESLEEKKNPEKDSVEGVEKILNYSFSNKNLLKEAITQHSGMMSRLQILGDKALNLAFTKDLYFPYPKLSTMGLSWPHLRVDMRFCTQKKRKFLAEKVIVARGCDEVKYHAEITAAKKAFQELSESMPVNRFIYQESLDIEKEHKEVVVLNNIQTQSCTKKLQLPKHLEEKKHLQMQECSEENMNMQMNPVDGVQKILNYSFTNKGLLKEAITYKSGMKNRLEILGKKSLCLAFTKYFYFAFPDLTTKGINSLLSVNRCTEKYARVAINHGLDKFLKFDRRLHPNIDEKVKLFSEAVSKEDGPVLHGGLVIAPKILSGIVESIAGAVYIDVNYNVSRLWEICKGLFEPFYTLDDLKRQPQPVHSLTRLGDKHGKLMDFRYLEDSNKCYTCEVYMDDEFIARGRSQCRDSAKLAAANVALHKLSQSKATKMVMETVIQNTEEETVFETTETEKETVVENTEIEHAKDKLIQICKKRKWPKPIYNVVSDDPAKGFVCSVEIETPTEEGTSLFIMGDSKKRKKQAESNSASHMIRALEISLKDDLRRSKMHLP